MICLSFIGGLMRHKVDKHLFRKESQLIIIGFIALILTLLAGTVQSCDRPDCVVRDMVGKR